MQFGQAPKFKSFPHDKILRSNSLCMNCLKPGHFVRECQSSHRCRRCQKPHHTLLHVETRSDKVQDSTGDPPPCGPGSRPDASVIPVALNATVGIRSNVLLMTSYVVLEAPNGTSAWARALLDSASSASERLAQALKLPHTSQNTYISGVAGLTHKTPLPTSAFHLPILPTRNLVLLPLLFHE